MTPIRIFAILVAAFGVLVGGFFLAGTASAGAGNHRASLIERLASRFNISRDDVKSVFDEDQKERETEMKNRLEAKLSEAAANGTLTEDQKSLIMAKCEEWQNDREANSEARRDMTPEERRADAKKHREEMEAWAKSNNIPEEFVGFGMGGGMRGYGAGAGHVEK